MNFGKMLSFISPAYGMATGQGLGKAMPYLSPGFGMLSGKGPFAGLLGGGNDQQQPEQPTSPPAGMFGAPKQSFGNALSAGINGYLQNQQGGGQMGMDPMMLRYMMMQRGGY